MDKKLTYGEVLALPAWRDKRKEILARDKLVCQHCKNQKYYEHCLKGLFIGFLNNQSPGFPIFFLTDQESYFLTRKLAEELDIRKMSIVFVKKDEDKLIIYASRELNQREAEEIQEWNKTNFLRLTQNGESENNDVLPFPTNQDSDWTFVRDLHIHHTYYQTNLMPWEYPNDSLQTLCWLCHSEVHENTDIPVYAESGNLLGYFDPCNRCSGAGYIPIYKRVQNGVCFACGGNGYLSADFIRKDAMHSSSSEV